MNYTNEELLEAVEQFSKLHKNGQFSKFDTLIQRVTKEIFYNSCSPASVVVENWVLWKYIKYLKSRLGVSGSMEDCGSSGVGSSPTDGTIIVYVIYCSTGCTCCAYDNHYRGFYETKEAADRRIKFFLDPNAHNNPTASQYAKRGRYGVEELILEKVQWRGEVHYYNKKYDTLISCLNFIDVAEDGSIEEEYNEERVYLE